MTTADDVRKRAVALARAGTTTEDAISEVLECCGDKRVSLVLARRELLSGGDEPDPVSARASELLDEVLRRLPE